MEKLVLVLLVAITMAHGLDQLSVLQDGLFEGYDKMVKPPGKTKVKVGLELLDLSICPGSQKLKTSAWLQMRWDDPRLTWDAEANGNITALRVQPSRIWMPDFTLYNAAAATESIYLPGEHYSNAIVYAGGHMLHVPPMIYRSHCDINYADWPWGVQNCTLKFGSWTYSMDDLDVELSIKGNENGLNNSYFQNNQIEILEMTTHREEKKYDCCEELYPNLQFTVVFKRTAMFQDGKLIKPPTGI